MRETLHLILDLTKFRIAVLATFSSAAGYIMAAEAINAGLLWVMLGTLLLSCGSLALNQVQEWRIDALMPRTANRPIPSGRMSFGEGLVYAIFFIAAGLILLWGFSGGVTAILGVVAVVWYNGFYTYLKRWSAFAVVPGSVIGALPPMMGWTAGGGFVYDPTILAVALFFFIWQVPHFWLLLQKYGKQYEQAHLRSLTAVFSTEQLTHLTFVWIVATAVTCLMLPLFGAVYSHVTTLGLLVCAFWLVWTSSRLLKSGVEDLAFRSAFRAINVYVLLVIVLLSADKLIKIG